MVPKNDNVNVIVKSASGLTYCLQPKHIFLNKNRTIWAHSWCRYDNLCYFTKIGGGGGGMRKREIFSKPTPYQNPQEGPDFVDKSL